MGLISKKNLKVAATEYAPMILGIRIPGFIRIHIRYLFNNPFVYCVLVVAPFIIGLVMLLGINADFWNSYFSGWHVFLMVLFAIATAFYFAERHRTFRKIYVRAVPAMVVINGFFIYIFDTGVTGSRFGGLIVFIILALLPAWVLAKLSMGMGYRMLSNGADRHYRPGRDLYMDGDFEAAFRHLEPSAKRGHMKSLFLLGEAHEYGKGRALDRIKAARFYNKSAKKGYRKAHTAFEALTQSFSPEEKKTFENDLSISGINDLF